MKWQSYRNKEPKAQPPRPFNNHEALESIRRIQAELDQAGPWPENITAWLQDHHPAALQAIRQTTKGIDHACLHQDSTGLKKGLAEYKQAWLNGLTLWRSREQQPSMMAA